jgi:type III pantothenate kinase
VQTEILLIDQGNTQCKSRRLVVSGKDVSWNSLVISDSAELLLENSSGAHQAVLASVRDDKYNEHLKSIATKHGIELRTIHTEKNAFGLQNSYETVKKMGVDRWLAMLGAQLFAGDEFIVIDAGTAITCDRVSKHRHAGGWITPGYRLLVDAVTKNTDRVTSASSSSVTVQWGQDTEACLHNGCLAQIRGLVLAAINLESAQCTEVDLIISGGDAHLIDDPIIKSGKCNFYKVDNIVMFGLLRYALENFSTEECVRIASELHTP